MSVLNLSWGLPVMNRLNKVHRAARVQLPQSVIADSDAGSTTRTFPIIPRTVGIIAFMMGGVVVIAAAGLLALSI